MSGSGTSVTIEFGIHRYMWAHHHKPRGYRLWYFCLPDDFTFSHAGTYSEAKRAAAKIAGRHCRNATAIVQVCA